MSQKQERRSEYIQKLRDPRWQKKRLEVLSRDEFTCQYCFDSQSTLNVHHKAYTSGKEPWEYEADFLVTLCESCHEEETKERPESEKLLLRSLRLAGLSASDVHDLACSFATHHSNGKIDDPSISALSWVIRVPGLLDWLRNEYLEHLGKLRTGEDEPFDDAEKEIAGRLK